MNLESGAMEANAPPLVRHRPAPLYAASEDAKQRRRQARNVAREFLAEHGGSFAGLHSRPDAHFYALHDGSYAECDDDVRRAVREFLGPQDGDPYHGVARVVCALRRLVARVHQ